MAEGLSYVSENRLLFGIQGVEQRSDFKELNVSERARNIARLATESMAGNDDANNRLNALFMAATENPGRPRTLRNFGDLIDMGGRLGDRMPPNLRQLEYDMVDGVGIALQTRMNGLKPKQADEVREGLRASNYALVDDNLSGGRAGVLEGVSECVGVDIITSSEVLAVLETLNNHLTREGRLSRKCANTTNTQIRRLYANADVPNGEVAKLNQYFAWALEDAGMTQVGSAPRVEPGVPPVVPGGPRRGAFDGKQYGAADGMERIAPIQLTNEDLQELVEVQTDQSMRDWMVRAFVRMSEGPLFFANWWQQSVVDSVVRTAQTKLGYGDFSKELNELRDYGYAAIAVLGMQELDRNADANSDNYGQFAPPKNMAQALHWDDGEKKYKILKGDPQIGVLFGKIFANAFDNDTGWKVVRAFTTTENSTSQNEYLRRLIGSVETRRALTDAGVDLNHVDSDLLLAKGRVAMAMFEVDWMPEWIRTMNERKRNFAEGVAGSRDVPWLQAFNDAYYQAFAADKTNQNKRRAAGLRRYDTFAYAGTLSAIVPGQNEGKEFAIGYDHPRVMRIWDVAAGAKGSYKHRPEVIWRMENVLKPFYAVRTEKDGRWLRLSVTNSTDRYLKLGKAMFEIVGGPQAAEWDNITNMDKILPTVASFWTGEAHGNPEFGSFMADLFAAKTDAMFYPGYPHNGDLTYDKIAGLDAFSGEMEKQKALEGILGPKGSAAHGFVAEMKRLYNVDLLGVHRDGGGTVADYPQFYDAYIRVFMDEPDGDKAWKLYKKSIHELDRKKYTAIGLGGLGVFKAVTGSR